jgi:hypothetical protein
MKIFYARSARTSPLTAEEIKGKADGEAALIYARAFRSLDPGRTELCY